MLLPLFMQDHPELTRDWRILYKPRGELIEPHTGRRIGLGTAEVAALPRQLDQRPAPRRHRLRYARLGRPTRAGRTIATAPSSSSRRAASPTCCGRRASARATTSRSSATRARASRPSWCSPMPSARRRPDLPADRLRPAGLHDRREPARRHLASPLRNEFEVIDVGLRLDQVAGLETSRSARRTWNPSATIACANAAPPRRRSRSSGARRRKAPTAAASSSTR